MAKRPNGQGFRHNRVGILRMELGKIFLETLELQAADAR